MADLVWPEDAGSAWGPGASVCSDYFGVQHGIIGTMRFRIVDSSTDVINLIIQLDCIGGGPVLDDQRNESAPQILRMTDSMPLRTQ